MDWFMNAIAVSVAVCSFVKNTAAQGAQVRQGDNAEQFALLCRIYNVAKNLPIDHVDLQNPYKIVNEINALNVSLAEEMQFNETEQMWSSVGTQLKPTITREAAVAQAILRRITQKAHTILEEIKKNNVTEEIKKATTDFTQVIFGEVGDESQLCQGALKDVADRGGSCGKPGLSQKGESAGNNLVVDFFCLCAMRTDSNEGINEVCGVLVGGKGDRADGHAWGTICPLGSSSMWASIKKGCGKHMHQPPKSAKEGHELLQDFLNHLHTGGVYRWGTTDNSKGVEGSNRKAGMLGTGAGTKDGDHGKNIACDGTRGNKGTGKTVNPGGVCVYYGPENWEETIYWLKKFRTALNTVDILNNKTATIQQALQKLQMLQRRAEEIYETAKVISKIQNPVVPTAFQNASGNLTAYNAMRTRSYSPKPYVALPWALLFL